MPPSDNYRQVRTPLGIRCAEVSITQNNHESWISMAQIGRCSQTLPS